MPPRFGPARWVLAALLAATATACFRGYGQPDNPFRPEEGAGGEVQVAVENQNFNDATVWIVRGGERLRLGYVTGKSSGRFTVDWNFTLPLVFEVELVGSRGCETRPLDVGGGDRVWLRVPVELAYTECISGIR